MSKAISNHFHGTTGERRFKMAQEEYEDDIIKERVQGLDLREHPVKHKISLSIKEIKWRINNRTAPIAYRIILILPGIIRLFIHYRLKNIYMNGTGGEL